MDSINKLKYSFLLLTVLVFACKKDKERELTEENSVFTSLTLNDSIGERTWNIMLDTIFQKVNKTGFVNSNMESFLEIMQPNKDYTSYNATWNNIINDSVDIY